MVRFGWQAFLLVVSLAAVTLAGLAGSLGADADDVTVQVAIDTNVAGNGDNVLGTTEDCNETPLQVGDTIDVDVVVRDVPMYVPPSTSGGGFSHTGLGGFDFNFLFDHSVVEVTAIQAYDGPSILKAGGQPMPFVIRDYDAREDGIREGPPGVTGNVLLTMLDGSLNYEGGDGVLTRISLKAVGEGVSRLELQGGYMQSRTPNMFSSDTLTYAVTSSNASMAVGDASCVNGTPGPYPTATKVPFPIASRPTDAPAGYSIWVEPATVTVGEDVVLAIKAMATDPGIGYYFFQLLLGNATFVSCANEAQCVSNGSGIIDVTEFTGGSRTGNVTLADVTVHVDGPGIVAELVSVGIQNPSGQFVSSLVVGNRYVTTVGVTAPPTPSPTRSLTPTPTAPPMATATSKPAAPTPIVTPANFPPAGGAPGSGISVTIWAALLGGAFALSGGYVVARRRVL